MPNLWAARAGRPRRRPHGTRSRHQPHTHHPRDRAHRVGRRTTHLHLQPATGRNRLPRPRLPHPPPRRARHPHLPQGGPTVVTRPTLVVGIDPSLTATGIAHAYPHQATAVTDTITTKGTRTDSLTVRHTRLTQIATTVLDHTRGATLAVIEGPSYGSVGAGTWDRGGLWWLIVDALLSKIGRAHV